MTTIPIGTNFLGHGGWFPGTAGPIPPGVGAPLAPVGRGQPPPGAMGVTAPGSMGQPAPGVNGAAAPWRSGTWGSVSGFTGFVRGRGNLASKTPIGNG